MRKIIALLILMGGISMLSGLWPMPGQLANEYRSKAAINLAGLPSVDTSSKIEQSLRTSYQETVNDTSLEMKFWYWWLTKLALFVSCVVVGWLMLIQARFWAASTLIYTVFYASVTGLFFQLYVPFIRGTTSLSGLSNRLDIIAKNPSLLFNIIWFNLIISLVFIVGSYMAIKSMMVEHHLNKNIIKPKNIIMATRLLWLIVVLGLINYCLEFIKPGHGAMQNANIMAASCTVLVFLYWFINHNLIRAKKWARWLLLISSLSVLYEFFIPEMLNSSVNLTFAVADMVLGFCATYLVFSNASKVWFNQKYLTHHSSGTTKVAP